MATVASIGDGVDARHGLGQQMQRGADGDAANARPSRPPATLSSRPSKTDSRMITLERAPRASRTRVFAPPPDGLDQQQTGDIDASNQQDDGYGQKQSAQQRPRLCDRSTRAAV